MLIAALAIIVIAVCSMVLFYDILKKQIFDDLKANAHVISLMQPEELPAELNYDLEEDGLRITLVGEDGSVIYDSLEDQSRMENHRERRRLWKHSKRARVMICGNLRHRRSIPFTMQF